MTGDFIIKDENSTPCFSRRYFETNHSFLCKSFTTPSWHIEPLVSLFGLKENASFSSEREVLIVLNRENNSAAGTLEDSPMDSADRVEA